MNSRMPACKFYLAGNCTNPNCRFRHDGVEQNASDGFSIVVKENASTSTTTNNAATQTRPRLVVTFVVDTSASMRGSPAVAACDGMQAVRNALMQDNDLCCLSVFDTTVKSIWKYKMARNLNWSLVKHDICRHAAKGGNTSLYDAIKSAIIQLQQTVRNNQVYELVVLTDGADNSSTTKLEEVAELVKKPGVPNFNFVLMGIGLNTTIQNTLEQTLCNKNIEHAVGVIS